MSGYEEEEDFIIDADHGESDEEEVPGDDATSLPSPSASTTAHPTAFLSPSSLGRVFVVERLLKAAGGFRPSFLFVGQLKEIIPHSPGGFTLERVAGTGELQLSLRYEPPSPKFSVASPGMTSYRLKLIQGETFIYLVRGLPKTLVLDVGARAVGWGVLQLVFRTGTQLESFLAVLKHVEVVQDQLWPHRVAALWRATDSWGGAPQGEGLGPGLASPGGQGLQVGQGQGGGPASPGVVPVGMGRTNLVARFGAPGSLLDDGEEGEAGLTHHHHHQPLQQQQQQVDYLAWQQQQQERWHAAAAAGSSRAGQGSAGGAERLQGLGEAMASGGAAAAGGAGGSGAGSQGGLLLLGLVLGVGLGVGAALAVQYLRKGGGSGYGGGGSSFGRGLLN